MLTPTLLLSLIVLPLLFLPLLQGASATPLGAAIRWQEGKWVVMSVEPRSAAHRAGLRAGDVLVVVDGSPPHALRQTDPGPDLSDTSEWTVLRSGRLVALRPDSESDPWLDRIQPLVLLCIALVFWLVATFVVVSKPRDGLARRFFWLNLDSAVILALTPAVHDDAVWAYLIQVVGLALLPAFLVDFALGFARGAAPTGLARLSVKSLYLVGGFTGGLFFLLGIVDSPWYDPVQTLLGVLLMLAFTAMIIVMLQAASWSPSPEARGQARVVLAGSALAMLPAAALNVVPGVVGLEPLVSIQVVMLAVIAFPVSFAYAILRHQLLGIQVVVGRTLLYAAMTGLLASGYGVFIRAMDVLVSDRYSLTDVIETLLFFALVTVTFASVRNWLRQLIDHLIYGDRYDYAQTLRALGAQLASPCPLDEALTAVAEQLAQAMNLRGAAFLLRTSDGALSIRGTSGEYRNPAAAGALLQHGLDPSSVANGPAEGPGYWIPLQAHDYLEGALYLGPKRSMVPLTSDDWSLVQTIAGPAAIAINHALLVEKLQAKVVELELLRDRTLRVAEDERKRIAQDLHDGPLHTILSLLCDVDEAAGVAADLPGEARSLAGRLLAIADRGRDAAHDIRTVCRDLYPAELGHLGLVATLENLARIVSREENLAIAFGSSSVAWDQRFSQPAEVALYRVAREAVDNACRHAAASQAEMRLELTDGRLTLSVRDDGRGFVPPSSTALLQKGHLGMATMRERVEQLSGGIAITSTPGSGTMICAWVPTQIEGESDGGRR